MTDIRFLIVALLPRLRGFALALTRSGDGADDLVQATCEKALRACDSWMPGTRLDSWMFRIMQNHWIDTKRMQRPHQPIEDEYGRLEMAGDDGPRITEARLTLGRVRGLIDILPEDQRAVLLLVCLEEMSYRDASEVLDIPVGTVMSRLSRARRTLIEAMEGESPLRSASGDKS
jgi:RNA polymerase sigma-70 factor (ECF subfamily)